VIDPARVQPGLQRGIGEEPLDLRGEPQAATVEGVEEWADADAIAGDEQSAFAPVPEGERELAVQPLAQRLAVLLVEVDEHFTIGLGREAMAVLDEFPVKLGIVEDLAVEDGNHLVVLTAVGLMSPRHVHDGEPPGDEAHALVSLDREVIGPPVLEAPRPCDRGRPDRAGERRRG